jgi:hypothetical protein
MSLLKKWFSFYVFANIHVGLAAFCLTQITMKEFGAENRSLAYFVFFSTILAYNFMRIFQLDRINSMIAIWIRSNKNALIVLNSFCLVLVVYLSLNFRLSTILVLLPFLLVSFFYVIPGSSKIKGLRHVPGFKLFLISFTWAGVTLYLPLFVAQIQEADGMWIAFVQRFLFIMALAIPFDIRDAYFDFPDLKTLPQLIGIKNSKVVAILAMVIFALLECYRIQDIDASFMALILITVLSIVLILGSGLGQKRFYSSFWVESIPVFWYILLLTFADQVVF